MKHDSTQSFLDIYVNNDNVSMLVALKNGKVAARAIIWGNVDIHGKSTDITLMDRIYYTHDFLVESFKDFARENGYYHKYSQSADNNSDSNSEIVSPNGEKVNCRTSVKLENLSFERYPYMDTFYSPDYVNGRLYNNYDYPSYNSDSQLRQHSSGIPGIVYDFIGIKNSHHLQNHFG